MGETLANLEVNAINGSLWTLKNEVMFYVLVPLVFLFYKKFGLKFLAFLYFISIIYILTINYFDLSKMIALFPSQLRLFIVGVFLYVFFSKLSKEVLFLMGPISIISIYLFSENEYFKFLMYPILLGFILLFIIYCIKEIKIKFDFSYSFYILHFPVIQLAIYFNINPSNPILSFVFLFSIIIFLSFLSEKYIEKRFIRIGKKVRFSN